MDFLSNLIRKLFLIWALLGAGIGHSQSFSTGHQKYQKGDFAGAEAAFSQALKSAPAGEKPKILKFRGICQFMMGNKNGATLSFKEALSLAPSLTIDATDVLDEGVIPFFESIRSSVSTTAKPEGGSPGMGPGVSSQKESSQTLLKINSTPPEAEISIDGIFAGRGGDLINVEPGTITVTIKAPDHEPKEMRIPVKRNRENTVNVILEKIRPKPRREAKPKEPVPSQTTALEGSGRKKDSTTPGKKPTSSGIASGKPQQPAGNTPNLAQEFEMDAASATATMPAPYPPSPQVYGAPGYYGGYGYRPPGTRRRYQTDTDYFYLSLPFGVGQFHQDRNIAGAFFLAAESYGIYLAAKTSSDLSKLTKAEAKARADCRDENNPCTAEYSQRREKFINEEFPSYRRKAKNTVTAASIAVFSLMIWGAADAIIKDPSYQNTPPPRRSRRASGPDGPDTVSTPRPNWDWHLALAPSAPFEDHGTKDPLSLSSPSKERLMDVPGLIWNVEWNF